jgi:4-amino-4-deoxy-L-arabinose transferase-like glycosyltransferase
MLDIYSGEVREKIKMNKKLAGLSLLIILPLSLSWWTAKGSADNRIGYEYDPKCPGGHSIDYCQAFADGYDDGGKSSK